jgi:aminoglycoside 6'-N-acetyltransferase
MIDGERTRLRPATPADLDLLERWFADPEVYAHWGGKPLGREEIAAKYTGARSPSVEAFIVEAGGEPVGYIQYDDGGGIDTFLAPAARGKGLAVDAVDALVRHLMDEERWRRVTVDPLLTNPRAIAFWFRAGFRPVGGLQTPEGPAMLMARRRVHPWMLKLRDRKQVHKRRNRLFRTVWAGAGVIVILIGLALIPLPGPGWLVTAAGVFMLALEFDHAERLLEKILDRLEQVTEQAQNAGPWAKAALVAVGLAGVAATVVAALLWDVPFLPV